MSGSGNLWHWRSGVRAFFWTLAFAPALLVLAWLWPRRVPAPYYDSWSFVKAYRDWCDGHFGWREWLTPHNQHPCVIGRAIYFAVLHWMHGNVALLPLLGWFLSLVISLSVLALSRPLWRGRPLHGAFLMFLANLGIFTAAQGHCWNWDFLFQNFIPGACLALGLLLLSVPALRWWHALLAALAALVATFSFGTGFAVGFLLLPALWLALPQKSLSAKGGIALLWGAFFAAAAWLAIAFQASGEKFQGNDLSDVLARPIDLIKYVLVLLGGTLGIGTSYEPSDLCCWLGVVLVMIVIACLAALARRVDRPLCRACWPWLAFVLWALLNAAAICMGRFRSSFETALAPRYGTFTLFMPLGALLLWTAVCQRTDPGWIGRWLQRLSAPAAALLLAAHALSWNAGGQSLELNSRCMSTARAALYFSNVLPPLRDVPWTLGDGTQEVELARFLQERHKLPGMKFAPDASVASLRLGSPVSDRWAHWELARLSGGGMEMRGTCGLSKDWQSTPDLILITAQPPGGEEKVLAMVPIIPPDDFLEREMLRRENPEHYFGWVWPVAPAGLVAGEKLRAYTFDGDQFRARPLQGEASLVIDSAGTLH